MIRIAFKYSKSETALSSRTITKMSTIRSTLNKIHDNKINEIKEKSVDINEILNLTNKNVIYNQIFDRVQNKRYRYM
jgi:hypothetical protein